MAKNKGSLVAIESVGDVESWASLPQLNGSASSLGELINRRLLFAAAAAPAFLAVLFVGRALGR